MIFGPHPELGESSPHLVYYFFKIHFNSFLSPPDDYPVRFPNKILYAIYTAHIRSLEFWKTASLDK